MFLAAAPLVQISPSGGTSWTDVAAIAIAVAAIVIASVQAHLSRSHNRLSVRPLLRMGWTTNREADGIWLKNDGLGPAIIYDFILFDNQGYRVTLETLRERIEKKLGKTCSLSYPTSGATMAPGAMHWIIRTKDALDYCEEQDIFWPEIVGATFRINYRSLYLEQLFTLTFEVEKFLRSKVSVKPSRPNDGAK